MKISSTYKEKIPEGLLMQMQPFSVNDGDGIRTTIFLAGCPLHCKWCSNPEGLLGVPVVGFYEGNCIGCGLCVNACPEHIGINLNLERQRCTACGACVTACPKKARKLLVSCTKGNWILDTVKKDSIFYRTSGGGITFSGGEATMQLELLDYLSSELYDAGYSLALETCGLFDFNRLLPILKRMDLIFMDLKHMDSSIHEQFTGTSNATILSNMKRLPETGADIVIRIPVIENFNADENNIRKSGLFVKEHLSRACNVRIELLPYHKLAFSKYQALGLSLPSNNFKTPTKEKMCKLKALLIDEGLVLADYR